MFLTGLGQAAPPHRYRQRECWDSLVASNRFQQLAPRSRAILKKVLLGDNGIESRYLALDPLSQAFELSPDALHARYLRTAPRLAAEAGRRALADAGLNADAIDGVIISTCTGYLCPGLTSYVTEQLGLRSDLVAIDLVGQGCGAAVPNLRIAQALLAAGQSHVLSICVEICSAAFYLDDDPGVLISACLFGDAAAAALLSTKPRPHKRRIAWQAAFSLLNPADRDYLRLDQHNGMLRNILTQQVPALAAKHAATVLADALNKTQLHQNQITGWILHAGGRDVLAALQNTLHLSEHDTRWSAHILREFGNVSSPCVLLALQAALQAHHTGGYWWLSTFGAGFSCHGALLEVQ